MLISVSVALNQTPAELQLQVCRAKSACLVPSLRQYQFILLGEQRHKPYKTETKLV